MAALPVDLCLNVSGGRIVAAATPGPATYLPCGTRLVYIAEAGERSTVAIDAEPCGVPLPEVIARQLSGLDAVAAQRAWTALEVIAKLTETPILTVLRGIPTGALNGLDTHAAVVEWGGQRIRIERYDTDNIWLALGRLVAEG